MIVEMFMNILTLWFRS